MCLCKDKIFNILMGFNREHQLFLHFIRNEEKILNIITAQTKIKKIVMSMNIFL